jgi:hypothetical protein
MDEIPVEPVQPADLQLPLDGVGTSLRAEGPVRA